MRKPAKRALKATPKFASEKAERAYCETHDSTEHLDWSQARKVSLPNLKPTTKTISLRLPRILVTCPISPSSRSGCRRSCGVIEACHVLRA